MPYIPLISPVKKIIVESKKKEEPTPKPQVGHAPDPEAIRTGKVVVTPKQKEEIRTYAKTGRLPGIPSPAKPRDITKERIAEIKQLEKDPSAVILRPGEAFVGGKVIPAKKKPVSYAKPYVTYSRGAYIQHTEAQYEKGKTQLQEWETQKSQIDVKAGYIDPKTGQIISGEQVLTKYYPAETESQIKEYVTASQKQWQQAKGFPEHAEIKGVVGGDAPFKITVDPVKGAQAEYQKLSPFEQFTRAYYVGVTKWPELAWEKLSQVTAKGAEEITGGYEAVGIFPKGTKKELEQKHREQVPDFTRSWIVGESELWKKARAGDAGAVAWDAATSPAMQEVYITLATLGIARAAPVVAKGGIRYGARVYGKVSRFVPEESLIGKTMVKAGTKIAKTEVGGKMVKWGVKGYKPFVQTTVKGKPIRKVVLGKGTEIEDFFLKKVYTTKGGKRILISPEAQKHAIDKVTKSLTGRKPVVTVGKYGVKTGRLERTIVVKQVSKRGGKIISRYRSITWGTTKKPPLASDVVFKAPGFEKRIPFVGKEVAGTTDEWARFVARHRATFDVSKTVAKQPVREIKTFLAIPEKRWHYVALGKQRIRDTLSNIQAEMSTRLQPLKPSQIYKTGFRKSARGLSYSEFLLPAKKPIVATPLIYSIISAGAKVHKVKPMTLPTLESRRDIAMATIPGFKPVHKVDVDVGAIVGTHVDIVPIKKVTPALITTPKLDLVTVFDEPKLPRTPKQPGFFAPTIPGMILPFRIPMRLYGRGAKQPDFGAWVKTKKYRERETFDPFEMMGDFDMKIDKKRIKQLGGM